MRYTKWIPSIIEGLIIEEKSGRDRPRIPFMKQITGDIRNKTFNELKGETKKNGGPIQCHWNHLKTVKKKKITTYSVTCGGPVDI